LPQASFQKNDKKAKRLIWLFSAIIFIVVALLSNFKLKINLGFDVHLFALANAFINITITVLLIIALVLVRRGKYLLHKKLMIAALILSVIFLISYIAHHLFAGEAKFGDINHDGFLSAGELADVKSIRSIYLFILFSHILLASCILPFILFSAYRGLTAEYSTHKKIARYTWPLWLYVSITGPVVYWMIRPYYG